MFTEVTQPAETTAITQVRRRQLAQEEVNLFARQTLRDYSVEEQVVLVV